jgi:hypothetical protein
MKGKGDLIFFTSRDGILNLALSILSFKTSTFSAQIADNESILNLTLMFSILSFVKTEL